MVAACANQHCYTKCKYPALRDLGKLFMKGETRPLSSQATHFNIGFYPKWDGPYKVMETQVNILWVKNSSSNVCKVYNTKVKKSKQS
ncbi:hypothetical protein PR048_008970 [Dryococelus australis]|uniref:Uncharacterized protein n=1 Tax=Dryococelus australis TaxID=614101 RepID=A0ABQ9HYK7_9NEOP|nr:hypothetical protein PR048_008970 [Dryococelus australis]